MTILRKEGNDMNQEIPYKIYLEEKEFVSGLLFLRPFVLFVHTTQKARGDRPIGRKNLQDRVKLSQRFMADHLIR